MKKNQICAFKGVILGGGGGFVKYIGHHLE